MLILPIDEAKPGMVLAVPVPHPEQADQDLLKSGYVLQDNVLARLRGLGIATLCVDFPGLDDLDRHFAASLSPARQKLYSQIKETILSGQKHTRPAVSYIDYYTTIRELVITLMSQGQHPVFIEHMSCMGGDAVSHATSVAHLSLMLGIKLETYLIHQRARLAPQHAREVVNIGVGGMLHDMGKLELPDELNKRTGIDPPENLDHLTKWQAHAEQGYEMVRRGIEPSAAAVVLHHHQRWDGSGFPQLKLRDGTKTTPKASKIHIFARVVAVANLYDRLASPVGKKRRRPNIQVLHLLNTKFAHWCDPTVLKVLQAITPPYPPGAIVTLSDHTQAVVVDINPAAIYCPIVKRLMDDGSKVDEKRIDLSQDGAPSITHIERESVEPYLPIPATEGAAATE